MTLSAGSVQKELAARFPDVRLRLVRDSILLEDPQDLTRVVLYLKEAPAFRLDYLSCVTASDFLEYLESIYHFYSIEKKTGPIVIRVRVPRKDGRIPSLTPIYQSADLQEREAYDLFGIRYEGHPDLQRLFLWEEFKGHPLLKDYEQEDVDVLEMADVEWLEARGVKVPDEMKRKARELKDGGKRAIVEKPVEPRPI
jgi:NADH:ubiquinone oxidoreductase subunit C